MFQCWLMLLRNFISAPGRSGEFEAVEDFVLCAGCVPTHQVANMQFGHFVVGKVERVQPLAFN